MGIPDWIVFGLVVGVVGQGIMSGRDQLGPALLGFIGVIGVLFGQVVGWHSEGESLGFLIAVAAIVSWPRRSTER